MSFVVERAEVVEEGGERVWDGGRTHYLDRSFLD